MGGATAGLMDSDRMPLVNGKKSEKTELETLREFKANAKSVALRQFLWGVGVGAALLFSIQKIGDYISTDNQPPVKHVVK